MKRDVAVFGLIIGLILPLIGVNIVVYIFSLINGDHMSAYYSAFKNNHRAAATISTLGLLINLAPFIFYTGRRLDQTAKGIFIATVVYAVIIFLLKFVW
jgi:hypothetical protein